MRVPHWAWVLPLVVGLAASAARAEEFVVIDSSGSDSPIGTVFASGAVKLAVRRPSPPEKSLGRGMMFHVAAIAGLTLMPVPVAPAEPQANLGSSPLHGIVWPVLGSPAKAPGSTVGTAFRL